MTTITEEATEGVRVKPLEFKPVEGVKGVFDAQSVLGYYRVDDTFQTPTAGGMKTVLPSWMGPAPAGYRHEYASIDEAFAAAQADYEARIRSALVAVPEQTDRYFAVDYTGCLYEWPDREAAIKAAEQFAETANGGEPVRTRAAALAAALVAPQAEGRDTGLREALRRIAGGHHPALGALVIAGDWRAAFGILQDIAKAYLAALPAPEPVATEQEPLSDNESTMSAMERADRLRKRGYVLLAASERLEREVHDRAIERLEHIGVDGI